MPDTLKIRAATQRDLADILALYVHLSPEDAPLDEAKAKVILQNFERYAGSRIFIGLQDNAVVSSCALVVVPNLTRSGTPYALIENVVTDTRFRKRGFGRAILAAAVAAAWDAGCYKVVLLAGSKSPAIRSFYENAGFSQNKTGFQVRRIPVRPEQAL